MKERVATGWGRVTQRAGQEQNSAEVTARGQQPQMDRHSNRDLRRSLLEGLQKGFV